MRSILKPDALAMLRAENARLVALLKASGIDWRSLPEPVPSVPIAAELEPSILSTEDKVALFRRLFHGRTDVYPIRWESKSTGKSGYAPACANEWHAGEPTSGCLHPSVGQMATKAMTFPFICNAAPDVAFGLDC